LVWSHAEGLVTTSHGTLVSELEIETSNSGTLGASGGAWKNGRGWKMYISLLNMGIFAASYGSLSEDNQF